MTRPLLMRAFPLLFALAACEARRAPGDSTQARSPAAAQPADTDAARALDVVREYYAAINARDYARAYAAWGDDGPPGRPSPAAFAAGFTATDSAHLTIGQPGRVEGAAGSRYLSVPVTVRAFNASGGDTTYTGTYTLRRSVVPGEAPAAQRWHLYRATLSAQLLSGAVATRDTVLLARDLNGDGRADSLVMEQKAGDCHGLCSHRAALYLDGARRPAWVSPWDDEDGEGVKVLASLTVSPTVTLLALDSPLADYDAIWIVRVSDSSAVTIGEHGIDYGQGDFALTRTGDTILVRAAPAAHLRLRGVDRVAPTACTPAAWSGVEARFDVRSGTFVQPRAVCIAARSP